MSDFDVIGEGEQAEPKTAKDWIETMAIVGSIFLLVITFPISVFYCLIVIAEYERAVVFRMGRLK
jgi:hypothetical protein